MIYLEELGRSCFSDPEAFVNWTWHRANGRTPDWIRAAIRNSKEWRERHGTAPATPVQVPIGRRLFRVTEAYDGPFHPRFYSYWSNAYVAGEMAYVFAGHVDGHAKFFRVDLETGAVERLGTLLPTHTGTTEGWSWDTHGKIVIVRGSDLLRVDPFNGDEELLFSIAESHPGCRLWQAHANEDGSTYCATVERITDSGPYERLGTIAVRHCVQSFFPPRGVLDESQVTRHWLVVKETTTGTGRLDNRIINLDSGEETVIREEAGAVGHSDCRDGLLVGEDDQNGACVLWDLSDPLVSRVLFRTWRMGHISARGGRYLLSDDTHISLVDPNGGDPQRLVPHGASNPDNYDTQVRANLDPSGRVACYMSDAAGRHDVYLLVL